MTARPLFARTSKATVRITTVHPNAIRHNVRTTTQPGNSRGVSVLPVLVGVVIGMPLAWLFVHGIVYLASIAP
jgi:hypothetical protein